jgi:hypothetical protein
MHRLDRHLVGDASLQRLSNKVPSNLALENMLTQNQSLRSLTLICPAGRQDDITVATSRSGSEKNSTLREVILVLRGATTVSPILTCLRDHPLLRTLCLRGHAMDLIQLETVLLSDTSKITELEIHMLAAIVGGSVPMRA